MAFSRILALLPLIISAAGLIPTVDARSISGNAYRYSSGGAAFQIPADYTVPLAPASVAGAPPGLPPPPGITFDTALPPPPANVTLAYVVLVRGVWNYTCENNTANPNSIGGVATLYDLAPVIPYLTSENDLHRFPPLAVNVTKNHIQQVFNLGVIGKFYHSSPHTAIIDLGKKGYFVGATAGHLVRAGSGSLGPDGSGALSWLIGNAQPGSVGLKMFYRVEVAGGVEPANCEGRPFMNTQEFACEYWIYN